MIQHIVIVADELRGLGGVQKYVHTLARNFFQLGFRVSLISRFHTQQPFDYSLPKQITSSVIFDRSLSSLLKSKAADTSNSTEIQTKIDKVLALGREKLRALINSWDGTVAVISTQTGSLMDLFACGLDETAEERPLIIAQYHGTFEYAKKQSYFPLMKSLYPRSDVSLFLTESDAKNFAREGFTNSEYIPNGVAATSKEHNDWNTRSNKAVFLGRISKEKSLDELLDSWSLLHKNFNNWSLEIYGSGPEEANLVSSIEQMNLNDSVKYMGPTDDVNSVLATSKLHVMSSHKEGFPIVLLEAASNRTPSVIYSSGPSSRELVINGVNGYVTRKNCPLELAKCMSVVLADQVLNEQLSLGCDLVAERFSMESVMNQWVTLLDVDPESLTPPVETKPYPEQKRLLNSNMNQSLQIFSLELPVPTNEVSLGIVLATGTLKEKDLVVTVECTNVVGEHISNEKLSLSYSSALEKSFAYAPALMAGKSGFLSALSSDEAFTSLNIQVLPWNKKRTYDDVHIAQVTAQIVTSINGRLVYQTFLANENDI